MITLVEMLTTRCRDTTYILFSKRYHSTVVGERVRTCDVIVAEQPGRVKVTLRTAFGLNIDVVGTWQTVEY